jgi:urea transport system ATP-binding protein
MSSNGRVPVLEVDGLTAGYHGVPVVHDVTLSLYQGQKVALLGRNGAGKTTLLASIMGLIRPFSGSVSLSGAEISGRPAHVASRSGLGYVPQGRRLFPRLTVDENLRLAARSADRWRALAPALYRYFPVLHERRRQLAGTLSGGEQQMAALARALASEPRVLLLDEPSEGLSPVVIRALAETLERVTTDRGVCLLLVEQNLEFAARVAKRAVLMDKGRLSGQVAGDDLATDPRVRELLSV